MDDRAKRARRQTNFFTSLPEHDSKKKVKKISIDVGEVSKNLRPILRTKSTSTVSAKKIIKKYSKSKEIRSVKHSERCQIRLVTPLPGWREDLLRMEEESDQEKVVHKSAIDLFSRVTITPESLERLAITCKEDVSAEARIQFNARIKHDDTLDMTPIARRTQKQKKKIISNSVEPSVTPVSGDDITKSLQSLHNPDRKQRVPKVKSNLSSWILSSAPVLDSTLEKENAAFDAAAAHYFKPHTTEDVSEPIQPRKSKRRSFCKTRSDRNPGVQSDMMRRECHTGRRRSLAKPNTDIDCDTMRKPVDRKILKPEKKSTERKERVAFAPKIRQKKESAVENAIQTRNLECKEASSPEIFIVNEKSATGGSKRKRSVGGIKAKRLLCNSFDDEDTISEKIQISSQLDWAPFSPWHVVEPISIINNAPENKKTLIETSYFCREPRKTLEFETFPVNDEIVPMECIVAHQITDAEKEDFLSRLNPNEQEWVNIFNRSDPELPWSEAFSPKKLSQWLGNSTIPDSAGLFVRKWKKRVTKESCLNVSTAKNKTGGTLRSGDTSDTDSDFEEDELMKSNPLILCGPCGSGKSALISALASELDMNIVEVHPGDKRGAAALKQKFDGTLKNHAWQHKNNSIAKFLGTPAENSTTRTNLIVIEHVDIHFKEDNDFWPALKGLAKESQVPMIFTCESLPYTELEREPLLDSYDLLQIDRCELMQLVRYIRCCLWITKNLDVSPQDLAVYIQSFKCDLKRILLDLQLQTATQTFELYLPRLADHYIIPSVSDKETTYYDRQSFINDKKIQYSYLYNYLQVIPHDIAHTILQRTAEALGDRLPRSQLALDYLPYLSEMDKVENKKKSERRRRCLHYFHEVRNDRRIDCNDTLLSILYDFKMIISN